MPPITVLIAGAQASLRHRLHQFLARQAALRVVDMIGRDNARRVYELG